MTEDEHTNYRQEIDRLREELAEKNYELSQLVGDGEGELNSISVGHDIDRHRVVIEFGRRLKWFSLTSTEARGLAKLIAEHALHADGTDH